MGLLVAFAVSSVRAEDNDAPPPYQPGQLAQSSPDPIVAIVDGRQLHLSDLGDLMRELPAGEREMPFDALYPALLSDMIDHAALQLKARRLELDKDPAVARQMHAAAERALEQALLERTQQDEVTESAVRRLYADIYGGKTAVEQVHIRLILVGSAAEAAKALTRLKNGEDFAAVAREVSRDPSSVQGGDLGFLRREQLQPAVAVAVFALAPGEVTSAPSRTPIGWCLIRLEQRESVSPPSFAAAHDELRRFLTQQAIRQAAAAARAEASVKSFNLDGTPVSDQIDTTRADLPPKPQN
jgi:peptidyl-prolyl cis-trans isomerase C